MQINHHQVIASHPLRRLHQKETITSVGEKLEPSDSEWEGKTVFGKVWQFLKQRGLPYDPAILVLPPKRDENIRLNDNKR